MFNQETKTRFSKSFDKGNIIFSEGQFGREMYIILEGEVEIFRTIDNKEKTLAILKSGDIFGEMSIIDKFPRSASAIAKTNVNLLVINGILFIKLLDTNPEFSQKVIKMLINRIRNTNDIVLNLYNKDRDSRLISALNEFYQSELKDPKMREKKIIPKENFVKYCELRKGFSKTVIIKHLKSLREQKIIDFDGTSNFIFLLDTDRRSGS